MKDSSWLKDMISNRIPLRKLRELHPDKPDNCLRCRYFLDCKSYKVGGRLFWPKDLFGVEEITGKNSKYKIALLVAMNPGVEEDKANEILIGPAGKKLMEYVEEYLSDHIVYVTNAVKCYIPNENFNKKGEIPLANIRYCNQFLKEDIYNLKPDIIVGLGKIACEALDLISEEAINKIELIDKRLEQLEDSRLDNRDGETRLAIDEEIDFELMERSRLTEWINLSYIKTHHPSYVLHGGSDSLIRDMFIRVDAALKDELVKIPYTNKLVGKYSCIGLDFEWDYESGLVHTIGVANMEGCCAFEMDTRRFSRDGLLSDPHLVIVGHDLARAEVQKALELGITEINCQFMDTIILLRELIDDKSEQALKDFAYRHLLVEDYTACIPKDVEYREYMRSYSPEVAKICAADAWTSLYLWKCLKEDFREEYDSMELARQADMEMILPTAVMMHKGIGLDIGKVEEHRLKLVDLVPQIEEEFERDFYGTEVSSPSAVLQFIHQYIDPKCKDTTKETIQYLIDNIQKYPINETTGVNFLERLLDYRQKAKLVQTYLKPLPNLLGKDGAIHSYIQIAGANNGRPTSSSPNIANLPRRSYNMKDIFCSKFGAKGVLGTLDASESEFRHFAYLAQDEWLIENYRQGIGMHDTVSKEVGISRDNTKTLNFARLYYAKPPKLKSILLDAGLKGKDLETKLKKYLQVTQPFQKYQDQLISESFERGYVLSPDGRRGYRLTPNTIANFPVSAFSSYSNKRRLVWLFNRLREEKLATHIWLDYYDSCELDIYLPELSVVEDIIKDIPQNIPDILGYDIELPLNIELKIHGRNWS